MSVISVENVSKSFRLTAGRKLLREHIADLFRQTSHEDFCALTDLSFRVEAGEGVGIIGPNGAGKSTLLSMIAGLLQPDTGHVEVSGRVAALLQLGSGFHPDLTGRENVFLNAALLGFDERQVNEVFGQIADFAELGPFMDQPQRTYSAGMWARLAFAVAVHVEPDILIVDEVLGVGDAAFQEKCSVKIRPWRKEGRTLVCVSHAPTSILSLCDRAIWLDHGHLIQDGPAPDVVAAYSAYMSSPHKGLPPSSVLPVGPPAVQQSRPSLKRPSKARV